MDSWIKIIIIVIGYIFNILFLNHIYFLFYIRQYCLQKQGYLNTSEASHFHFKQMLGNWLRPISFHHFLEATEPVSPSHLLVAIETNNSYGNR